MILVYVLFGMLLCFRAVSVEFDKCEVPLLKADLSFTLKNYSKMNGEYKIDYDGEQMALLNGYGVWKFAVIQNYEITPRKAIKIVTKCVRDCPSDPVSVPSMATLAVKEEKGIIFEYSFETLRLKKWDDLKNNSAAGLAFFYSDLSRRPYGQKVTVSFTMFVPKPERRCMKVETDEFPKQVSNQCFQSFRNNKPLVALQFRDKNFTIFPSILESHSTFLRELLDIQRGNEQTLVLDFRNYSSNIDEMFLEILCSGTIHETVLENRAQHISALMKVYELGHKYQMDIVMQAAIEALKGISPRINGPETFDIMQWLSIKKSEIGDDFMDNAIQVELNPSVVQQNQDEPNSKLRQLFNKMRL